MLCCGGACHASPRVLPLGDPASPLRLEGKIQLPDVSGRIDHLAIDLPHRLLFVAEYGNGTVDVVDLAASKVVGRIAGLHQPQGVAVLRDGEIAVACGDGSVHFFAARDRHEIASLNLGGDADNIRIDQRNGDVVVGYASGALAVIDPQTHQVISTLKLPGHPEGFAMIGDVALINVPDDGSIIKADLGAGKITATWPTELHRMNFPLDVSPDGKWAALAYRLPGTLQMRQLSDGAIRSTRSTCGDADGLFIDGARILVVCGSGHVDVASSTDPDADPVRVATASGARTGLLVPEINTLFVAAPAQGGPATIWMMSIKGESRKVIW